MPLDQYRTAEFKQGPLVRQEYQDKPEVAGGICYGLFVTWMKLTPIWGAQQDPSSRAASLTQDFKLAGTRQLIYKSGAADTVEQDHADKLKQLWSKPASPEFAQLLTELGTHSGVAFRFLREFSERSTLATVICDPRAKSTGLYLSIKFAAKGGHALGLVPGTPNNLLFDPNDGEFAFSDANAQAFLDDFWAAYANIRGGISTYALYAVTPQLTVQGKWESGSLGQTLQPASLKPPPGKLDASRFTPFKT